MPKNYQYLASLVFQYNQNAILIANARHQIILVNSAFTKITGYSLEEVLGKDPKILSSGQQDRTFYKNLWFALMHHGYWQGTIWNRRKDGEVFPEWQTIHVIRDKEGKPKNYFAIFSDISDSKILAEQLQRAKNYDALTGLPNKNLFIDRLTVAIKNIDMGLAVLFLNIDRFKKINDVYGMPAGDIVLKMVAKRAEAILPSDVTIAHITGDSYVILLPVVKDNLAIISIAKKLINLFKESFQINEKVVNLTASVGVTVCSDKMANPDELIKQADQAMELAKKDNVKKIAFFDASINQNLEKRLTIENELYHAIENNELLLYYQPQIDTKTGKLIGAEALIRWHHPKKGLVLPGDFIPVALETGLIIPMGAWVLDTACAQAARWQEVYKRNMPVAVNISVIQFQQDNFDQQVKHIVDPHGLDPHLLLLELTEQIMIENVDMNLKILYRLYDMGFKTSLDDFGTGYSSLSYLRKLPLSELKIDISFVQSMENDRDSTVITDTIIHMAKSLNLKTVAEGVETKGQLKALQLLGCDEIQGFYFSKPLTVDQFTELLKSNQPFKVN
ncbi:MAG: EAL domain-containing protein [Pseudomonadota bacterium]